MTEEEKRLVLIDLCSRLPYGVYCKSQKFKKRKLIGICEDKCVFESRGEGGKKEWMILDIEEWKIRPYLFSMDYMTNEEWEEYNASHGINGVMVPISNDIDWLNKHHFDHRGLIPNSLAIEAGDKDIYD